MPRSRWPRQGFKRMFYWVGTDNARAIGFATSLGFRVTSHRRAVAAARTSALTSRTLPSSSRSRTIRPPFPTPPTVSPVQTLSHDPARRLPCTLRNLKTASTPLGRGQRQPCSPVLDNLLAAARPRRLRPADRGDRTPRAPFGPGPPRVSRPVGPEGLSPQRLSGPPNHSYPGSATPCEELAPPAGVIDVASGACGGLLGRKPAGLLLTDAAGSSIRAGGITVLAGWGGHRR